LTSVPFRKIFHFEHWLTLHCLIGLIDMFSAWITQLGHSPEGAAFSYYEQNLFFTKRLLHVSF